MKLFAHHPRRLLVQNGFGEEHNQLLALTASSHAAYCRRHDITYRREDRAARDPNKTAHWAKMELLLEGFDQGFDQVCWLDTDCVIVDFDANIFDASGFGIAVCECYDSPDIVRHLNTGFMIATDSSRVREFLRVWHTSIDPGQWADQGAFIHLMAARPNREILTVLPNRYNCVAVHMDDSTPVVRAFHGDPQRAAKITTLLAELSAKGLL